jgi:Ca-activated chloride channel family protein
MNRVFFVAAFSLAGLAALHPQSQAQSQAPQETRPVIRANVDVVNLQCTVRDRAGRGKYVEGLKKEDFEVFEDNVLQQVQYFNHGMGADADPLSIALLIDASGSVKAKLGVEQRAAIEFLRSSLRENKDLAAVVQFSEDVKVLQDFTYDGKLLEKAIRETRAGGATKLYDAIWLASREMLQQEAGRRVIVVLSDGHDTLSDVPEADAIKAAQENDAVVFGIGARSSDADYGVLKKLTRDTGGLFVDAEISLRELRDAFAKINGDIKNQYSLGYVSSNTARDGSFRTLRVRVKRTGLNAKYRKGYYAPQAD